MTFRPSYVMLLTQWKGFVGLNNKDRPLDPVLDQLMELSLDLLGQRCNLFFFFRLQILLVNFLTC